jgi:hypothetical protein
LEKFFVREKERRLEKLNFWIIKVEGGEIDIKSLLALTCGFGSLP